MQAFRGLGFRWPARRRRCHCWWKAVEEPEVLMFPLQTQYAVIVTKDLPSLPYSWTKYHRPRPCGSDPEVWKRPHTLFMIPVKVPPGLYARFAGSLLVDPARSAVQKNSTQICSHHCRTAGFSRSRLISGRPRPSTSMSLKLCSISHKSKKSWYSLIPFGLI